MRRTSLQDVRRIKLIKRMRAKFKKARADLKKFRKQQMPANSTKKATTSQTGPYYQTLRQSREQRNVLDIVTSKLTAAGVAIGTISIASIFMLLLICSLLVSCSKKRQSTQQVQ